MNTPLTDNERFTSAYNREAIEKLLFRHVGAALGFHTLILPDEKSDFAYCTTEETPSSRNMLDRLYGDFKATEGIVQKASNNDVVCIREIGVNTRAVRIEEITAYDPPSFKVIATAVQ